MKTYDPGFNEAYRNKLAARISAKTVEGADQESCSAWTGALVGGRKPAVSVKRHGRTRLELTTRVVLELAYGRAPIGYVTHDAGCDQGCVNPRHLRDGCDQRDLERLQWEAGRGPWRRAKLTAADVTAIRHAQTWSDQTGVELARMFGVSPSMVSRIRVGKSWDRAVEGDEPRWPTTIAIACGPASAVMPRRTLGSSVKKIRGALRALGRIA
jgi:hypothetical protein